MAAAASCYLITLSAICQRRELPIESITLRSEATTTTPPALKLLSITHRPVITLACSRLDEKTRAAALDAAVKAEAFCMVSSALRNNVKIHVEALVTGVSS